MSFPLEYHRNVIRPLQRSVPASIALSAVFLFLAISASSAQTNNAASFAGAPHATVAAPPTHFYATPPTGPVTPRTGPVAPPTAGNTHTSGTAHNGNHHPHHTAVGTAYYPYVYALPVPYAIDTSATDDTADNADSADDDADYQGGPTIFDRRGQGPDSYVPPTYQGPAQAQDSAADEAAADPAPEPQPPTTLVFKDGHQVEVSNYAIVSQTLYDLTPGHPRKISLAELDLPATQKENDDHGVVFQLPASSQAN
jgi:hypothetical protein